MPVICRAASVGVHTLTRVSQTLFSARRCTLLQRRISRRGSRARASELVSLSGKDALGTPRGYRGYTCPCVCACTRISTRTHTQDATRAAGPSIHPPVHRRPPGSPLSGARNSRARRRNVFVFCVRVVSRPRKRRAPF